MLPPPDPEGRLSSTDLLSWWFRAPKGGLQGWDEYFSGSGEEPAAEPEVRSETSPGAASDFPPFPEARDAGITISSLFPEPEEQLADEHAQAAVDCLYEFIHAFGRRDIDAAMKVISEAYHTLEDDQEVDRLRFRQNLEAGLDSLRRSDIEVSLAQAPEPLVHPQGILIDTHVQIDTYQPDDDSRGCLVERRIAVLSQEEDGEWRIRSFGLVTP